jgi:hypothetical protein
VVGRIFYTALSIERWLLKAESGAEVDPRLDWLGGWCWWSFAGKGHNNSNTAALLEKYGIMDEIGAFDFQIVNK